MVPARFVVSVFVSVSVAVAPLVFRAPEGPAAREARRPHFVRRRASKPARALRTLRRPSRRWCLWFWCARPGPAATHGRCSQAPPRSSPVPSGPFGALRAGGPVVLVCPARTRRHSRAPQPTLTNVARNSPTTVSNLECASLDLQRFQRLLKLPSNKLCASFLGLAVYQDPRQTVGAIVRPGLRYRRAIPMCLGAIVGVFVPRYETDSTFASTSLQRNETVIAFASDERPFLGHFDPAKVLSVSMGRAAWPAKVLVVSKLPRHRVLCAKKFALRGLEWVCARNSSPCKPKTGGKCFFRRAGRVFSRESHWKPYAGRVFSRMSH